MIFTSPSPHSHNGEPTPDGHQWLSTLLGIILVVIMAIGVVAIYLVEKSEVTEQGKTLATGATALGKRLDRILFERQADVAMLSQAPVLHDQDPESITRYLRVIQATSLAFSWLGVTNEQGQIIAATIPATIGTTLAQEPAFQSIQGQKTVYVDDAAPRKVLGESLAIMFANAIQTVNAINHESSFKGGVFAYVKLDYLAEEFERQTTVLRQQYPMITSLEWQLLRRDGLVLYDSMLGEVGTTNLQTLNLPSAKAVILEHSGFIQEHHKRRDVDVLTGYAEMIGSVLAPQFKWSILVRRDFEDVLKPIRTRQWQLLAAWLFLLLLLGLLTWSTKRLQQSQALEHTANRSAQRAEQRFRTIVEAAPSGMVMIDQTGIIVLANRLISQQFGYTREQLLGQSIDKLLPEHLRAQHAGHRIDFLGSPEPRSLGSERDLFGWRQDGTEFPVEIGLNPLTTDEGTFVLASVVDITARKKYEKAIQQLHRQNELILNSAGEGIYGLDLEGNATFVNPAAGRMLGYDSEELLGKPMHHTIHHTRPNGSPYPQEDCPSYAAFRDNQMSRITDEVLWRKDGTSFPVEYTSTPIHDEVGRVTGAVVTFNDITTRKNAEDALEQYIEDLRRSNAELEQFAYVASHDLQEPLRKIRNFSELLEARAEGHLPPEARKFLIPIVNGAVRMQTLVQDLLTYSRVARGELTVETVDLQAIAEHVKTTMETLIAESHAALTIGPLPTLEANATQMEQLFQNLIGNGLKYRGNQPPSIEVTATDKDEFWEVAVRDNGIGIDPQFEERIFVIFQRLHTKKEYAGTGIGLAICKKIVELHGGQIWVKSKLNEGSTFYFTLPRTRSKAQWRPAPYLLHQYPENQHESVS